MPNECEFQLPYLYDMVLSPLEAELLYIVMLFQGEPSIPKPRRIQNGKGQDIYALHDNTCG